MIWVVSSVGMLLDSVDCFMGIEFLEVPVSASPLVCDAVSKLCTVCVKGTDFFRILFLAMLRALTSRLWPRGPFCRDLLNRVRVFTYAEWGLTFRYCSMVS